MAREKGFLVAMRIIISAVIASVAFIAWTSSVSAQDPAVVNKTVKVKFENEKVRVLEAELPAGVKEAVHSHPAYLIYVVAGGRVSGRPWKCRIASPARDAVEPRKRGISRVRTAA